MSQSAMNRNPTSEAGFTLIEVLCAAVIAAFAIIGLYTGLGTSLRATDRLERHLGARIVAGSVLAELANEPREVLQDKRGTSGRYAWQLHVERASGDLASIRPSGLALYDLNLVVAWAPEGRIEVNTVRLGPRQ
jgi:prepilin-type N-terminal cleavage/methylation domain-containing protein